MKDYRGLRDFEGRNVSHHASLIYSSMFFKKENLTRICVSFFITT